MLKFDKCPCEDCIVLSMCKNKVTIEHKGRVYLIIDYLKKCPFIYDYLLYSEGDQINIIIDICNLHNIDSYAWKSFDLHVWGYRVPKRIKSAEEIKGD